MHLQRLGQEVLHPAGFFHCQPGRFGIGPGQPARTELGAAEIPSDHDQDVGQIMPQNDIIYRSPGGSRWFSIIGVPEDSLTRCPDPVSVTVVRRGVFTSANPFQHSPSYLNGRYLLAFGQKPRTFDFNLAPGGCLDRVIEIIHDRRHTRVRTMSPA